MEEFSLKSNALKQSTLDVCRKLPLLDLVTGTAGNVSARDPESGLIAIKPSGLPYGEMVLDDILLLSPDGEVLEAAEGRKPSYETPTHLEIYRRFGDVNGVVHTHGRYVNILGSLREVIPCGATPTTVRLLLDDIPVIPFIDNGTQEMADQVAPAVGGRAAVVIRNHGPFLVGGTVGLALERAVALEDACEFFYKASLLGSPSLIPRSH